MAESVGAPTRLLLAVSQGASSPGPRYRALQYVPFFEAAGLDCTVWSLQSDRSTARSLRSAQSAPAARLLHHAVTWAQAGLFAARIARTARRFDRILLYRIPIPSAAVRALRPYRDRILFDFDDALDAAETEGLDAFGALRRRILRRGLLNAIHVGRVAVTSNEQNADLVRAAGGDAAIVPTSIDTSRVTFRDRRSLGAQMPVIGWMGTPSTARYLRLAEAPLREIASRTPVVVRLVGAGTSPFADVPADVRPWDYETEVAELHRFDLGIMPMPDTRWTRGKAALKALQYGASGAPTVASWTPTNLEILREDGGTVLCRSDSDWVAAIDRLIRYDELRSDLGRRGRELVERCYSVEVNAPRLIALIRA
jgi:glycosyltransferase involved in cell wall biosynthesis